MCGINGIFAYRDGAPLPSEADCLAVRDAMRERGPDGKGFYRDASARWDLPLKRKDLFERSLQQCLEMDQNTFNQWSAEARNTGTQGFEADALEKTQALLQVTSETTAVVWKAGHAAG